MESVYFSLFLVGLLGGVHCVGMCGGIVGALALGGPSRWSLHLAYNGGRICSYALAGALAGAVGAAGLTLAGQWPVRLALYGFANLMLLALGLYLAGATWLLTPLERLGGRLWRRLQPLTRRFLPARTIRQAFPLGLVWGWLPCGLVYSALVTALGTGSAGQGALAMLAFGLGTLPNLLLAGLMLARLQKWTRHPWVRIVAGMTVAAFGIFGLINVLKTL